MRCGAQTLVLLSSARTCLILRALTAGPQRQIELRRAAGSPAQTTMRGHLRALERIGAVVKHRRNAFPGSHEYEFERPGVELLFVLASLESWLSAAPDGPLELGSEAARSAIKALVEAWSSTMLRALAARSLSLTELDRIISGLSYPSLERRLSAMRMAGQLEVVPGDGKGTPYEATDWLRRGIAPILAATRWERRHLPENTAGITRIDVEAAFLLTMPLLRLPAAVAGNCRLALQLPNGSPEQLAGVMATVDGGRVASCTTRLQDSSSAWANGAAGAWLRAVIEADREHLEIGGDSRLARALLEGLFETLFGAGARRSTQRI